MLADIVEDCYILFDSIFKSTLPSLSSIETADDSNTLVSKRGSLVSGFSMNGVYSVVGSDEFEEVISALTSVLESSFKDSGHKLQVTISRDPTDSENALAALMKGSRNTCRNLNLDMEDIIDSRIKDTKKYVARESVFIAIWTTLDSMSSKERNRAFEQKNKASVKSPKLKKSGQNLASTIPEIRERHRALVNNFQEVMEKSGFSLTRLTAHEMVRAARQSLFPELTPSNWEPALPGDRIPRILRKGFSEAELDFSDIQYPPVDWQLFPESMVKLPGGRYVEANEVSYAPMSISIPQKKITDFNTLFEKLTALGLPYRFSFLLEGNGIRYVLPKATLSSFISWASPYNKMIDEAASEMKQVSLIDPVVSIRTAFCTWAPKDNLELLQARASRLANAVTSWGHCEVRDIPGDQVNALISTAPFLSEDSVATHAAGPLEEVLRCLPIARPASPWAFGGGFYRSSDGKVIPFQPGSSLQNTWVYAIFAPPGMGKSVQISTILQASFLEPGRTRIPRIAHIDIGPSGEGFNMMVKDALPRDKKHLVGHFRLRMTKDYCINVFDTQLGCRFPLPEHKSFLINFVSKVVTPPEMTHGYESMSQLVSKVIDELYRKYSDYKDGTPKPYSEGLSPEVDAILKANNFVFDDTSWWEIVDYLFAKGHVHEATLAQRYAVPTLSEATGPARDVVIADLYKNMRVSTGETITEAFSRLISDAVRDLPIISQATQFDIGDIRIATIDIDEVAKSGSDSANHQTALMYMLAKFALTKDYRMNLESLKSIPEKYHEYHSKRISEIKEDIKWIVCDEFHRTSKAEQVREDIIVDAREGRKFNIGLILASQSIDDFPESIVSFLTGAFIHAAESNERANMLQTYFGFNDAARQLLLDRVTGPGPSGAPFLGYFKLKKNNFCQLLWSSIGSIEKWATSTTAEDVEIRRALYAQIGTINARKVLAELYPGGTAKDTIERLRSEFAEEGLKLNAIDYVVKECLKYFNEKRNLTDERL